MLYKATVYFHAPYELMRMSSEWWLLLLCSIISTNCLMEWKSW